MGFFQMIDGLLRDRETLYARAEEGRDLGRLAVRLLLVFVVCSAVYGAAMGSFRSLHPRYVFSDFELTLADGRTLAGEVAGMSLQKHTVYTKKPLPEIAGATVRFNRTRPTEQYPVQSGGLQQGYHTLVLAPTAQLVDPSARALPLQVAWKTPALFLVTLAVCALALYVLNLAFGLRLHFMPTLTLMVFALAATGILLVVFAPITLLFSIATGSYHFMKILHVLVYAVAGLFGVKVLYEGMIRLAPEGFSHRARPVLISWLLLYCLVGGQVAWMLKPFLGTPYLPQTPPFRIDSGNIYVSTFGSFGQMMESGR
jgi:hypothetical protein